jgi:predicted nucleic acid-binding protein
VNTSLHRVYFDTSGIMRYLVRSRRGHQLARDLWALADEVVSAAITYVEVRAALAAGRRHKFWGAPGLIRLKQTWQEAWSEVDEIEVDRALLARAGDIAEAQGLRGFDAVQLTSAIVSGCDLFASADRELCAAAGRVQLQVVDLDQVEG